MKTRQLTIAAILLLSLSVSLASEVLPPEQVFVPAVLADADELRINWTILPDYYLYRHRFSFATETEGVTLGEPILPRGKKKTDEFFGESEIYRNALQVRIPYTRTANAPTSMTLDIRSQGCADIGLCYPPQRHSIEVALPARVDSETPGVDLMALIGDDTAGSAAAGAFLPPERAFPMRAEMAGAYRLKVQFDIADGYYLYRDKFSFATDSDRVQLGQPRLPPGKEKTDEYFGETEVYYNNATIHVPLSRAGPEAGDFEVTVGFQGCAEDGICYPPMTETTAVILPIATSPPPEFEQPVAEQDRLASLIRHGNPGLVALSFFGLGLLLAFTPCVFPMVPILSGIIVGQGPDLTSGRAFVLSAVYVLAMALTYTLAGVAAAMLGHNLQAIFQHPGVIIGFSLVFVLLALAMFGVYELQVPPALQAKLSEMSNSRRGGTTIGVAAMGVLSALIVGPCVAAPLAASLIVIGQSGDPLRGGLSLFALSLGMGAPLLVFGASAGHLLPRAGNWMNVIKGAFGVMLLGIAIWMLSRILPDLVTMLLWGVLAIMTGVFLGAFQGLGISPGTRRKLGKGAGIVAVIYGLLLVIGGALGGSNPLNPLSGTTLGTQTVSSGLEFRRIKSLADLQREVELASADGTPVMLDFYADWCVECKKMEKIAFHDDAVKAALADTLLLQADVTANDDDDRKLLNHFGVYGPPTIVFFGADGEERKNFRIVGYMNAREFEAAVRGALGN